MELYAKLAFIPPTILPLSLKIKNKVDEVLRIATWKAHHNADEGQWSAVAHLLLAEVATWPRAQPLLVIDTQRSRIGPSELYTKMPGDVALIYEESKSCVTSEMTSPSTNTEISKMVDWSMALDLSSSDTDKISKAFTAFNFNECSLNQSLSYVRHSPLFGDLEVKKQHQMRDPAIQIAIWKSAWLKKAIWHQWDTSLPMPAITVEGHTWHWYLFMAAGEGLVMLGPFNMGNTSTLNDIWIILYRLKVLFDWGATTYRGWFDEHILKWAENHDPDAEKGKGKSSTLENQTGALNLSYGE
ncbi:MAG: hypothetical protein Q9216_001904 [Gyalolechia sp. 2 TL-2023]